MGYIAVLVTSRSELEMDVPQDQEQNSSFLKLTIYDFSSPSRFHTGRCRILCSSEIMWDSNGERVFQIRPVFRSLF